MTDSSSAAAMLPSTSKTLLLTTTGSSSVLSETTPGHTRLVRYSPYGFRHSRQPVASSLGFNGEFIEPQGAYLLGDGHRLYSAVTGRFYSPDSLSPFDEGGLNVYAYCKGDPVNHFDPSGKAPFLFLLMGAAAKKIAKLAIGYKWVKAGGRLWMHAIKPQKLGAVLGKAIGPTPIAPAKPVGVSSIFAKHAKTAFTSKMAQKGATVTFNGAKSVPVSKPFPGMGRVWTVNTPEKLAQPLKLPVVQEAQVRTVLSSAPVRELAKFEGLKTSPMVRNTDLATLGFQNNTGMPWWTGY